MKKYVIISGLNLRDNNRGTAALGYGAISFLQEKVFLHKGQVLLNIRPVNNILKRINRKKTENDLLVGGNCLKHTLIPVSKLELYLFIKFKIRLPFSTFSHYIKQVECVAAINGGDGFSDIYGKKTFFYRLTETLVAIKSQIPVIQLPQTLGPFKEPSNYLLAKKILQNSTHVYVRDDKFVPELEKMNVKYEITKDLSAFMQPEPWDIEIKPNAIGINVSGLAYSNSFRTLSGQFEQYPNLIKMLIEFFQKKGYPVYLIPHSYCYENPEPSNDDMVSCKATYESLSDKTNVFFIDKNLISPQVKYVISKMSFFIGTRMHANFAAIYTGVPVFGLAYSYKFEGAFDANGLYGKEQTAMINNINEADVVEIKNKIESFFNSVTLGRI